MYHKVILVSLLSLYASDDPLPTKYPGQEIESASHFHAIDCFMEMQQVLNFSSDLIDTEWIDRLDQIPLPDSIQTDDFINVYFKYNKPISGYEVTARWMPFDSLSETGYVVMNFRDMRDGSSFQYVNFEKYNNFNTDEVSFSADFKGHHNGDVHYFDYPAPEAELHDGLYKLGYQTPFQLLDVNFDGARELLVSDWEQGKGGNHYNVYKIEKSGLELITDSPLDLLTTDARINPAEQTIVLSYEVGAFFYADFFYSIKKPGPNIPEKPVVPKEYEMLIPERYVALSGSQFRLDSVRIYCSDSIHTYKIRH